MSADDLRLGVAIGLGTGLVSGVVAGLISAAVIGMLRAPRLVMEPGEAVTGTYPHGTHRFVHVRVRNHPFRLFRWLRTRPATSCRAVVTIGDLGSKAPRIAFDGRWTSQREPIMPLVTQPGAAVIDTWLVAQAGRQHLNPDEQAEVAIAVKQDGEAVCFAFSNRSYLHQWKNPDWRLEPGTYWCRVDLTSGEARASQTFTLVNTGTSVRGLEVKPGWP